MNKTVELLLELGRSAKQAARPVEALKHFQAAINVDKQNAEAWYGRAEVLADRGQFSDAIDAFTRAMELDPGQYSAIGLFAIGNCHVGLGQRLAALAAYEGALNKSPRLSRVWHNQGMVLFDLGRYEDAAKSYASEIEIEPSNAVAQIWHDYCAERRTRPGPPAVLGGTSEEIADACMQIGTHEYQAGYFDRALQTFDRALKANALMAYALMGRAACLDKLDRPDEALQAFDRALSLDDEARALAAAQRAELLQRLGRQGAEDAYRRVLDAAPTSVAAQKARAIALQALEKHEAAIQCLAIVKKLEPKNSETSYLEGLSYEALGRFGEAAGCFGRFLGWRSNDAHVWFRRAQCLAMVGQCDQALECCDKAIELGYASADSWLQKGSILTALNRFADAIPCFHKTLEQKPNLDVALYNRGVCHFHLGLYDAAIRDFDLVLEQGSPHSAMALDFKTRSLRALNRSGPAQSCEVTKSGYTKLEEEHYLDAAELFKQALALDPNNVAASMRLAAFHFQHGSLQAASDQLAQVIKLRPRNADVWTTRGVVLVKLGQLDEADKCYAAAIEADPTYAPGVRNRANFLVDLGRFEEALAIYELALALEGQNGNAWYGRGVALTRLNRWPEAVESFRRAVEYAPNDGEAWQELGTCLVRLKQYSHAIEAWQKASRLTANVTLEELIRQLRRWTDGKLHWHSMLAYTFFNQGQFQKAAAYFDAALQIDNKQVGLLNDYGLCVEQLQGSERAIECFDKALALDADNAQTWYNKGVSLMRLGRFADSVAAYEKVMTIHRDKDLPHDYNLLHGLHNMGVSLIALGKKEQALDQFDEVLRLARTDPKRWQKEAERALELKSALLQGN